MCCYSWAICKPISRSLASNIVVCIASSWECNSRMALFRRTKSPRSVEFRNITTATAGVGSGGTAAYGQYQRQSEEHKRPNRRKGKRFSESTHRRHKSDELNSILESTEFNEPPTFLSQSEEVVTDYLPSDPRVADYQLSDPSPLTNYPPPQLPPRHRGGSGGAFNLSRNYNRPGWRRTQSGGNMSSPRGPHPPHQEYFVPADTLKHVQRSSFVPVPNGAVGGPIHHSVSIKDKRNKEMHERIVAHNDHSSMGNKRKSRSLENLIDICDYSVPFDPVKTDKSSSPDSGSGGTLVATTRSDSNLTMHNTSTPPAKPSRRTRDYNPPAFAPPPPPNEEGGEQTNLSHSPTVVRKGDDYEEPWNSSRFHLPRPGRRQRSETESKALPTSHHHPPPLSEVYKHPRSHRAHTINHETSPEPDPFSPGVPPRASSRNRSETAEGTTSIHTSTSPQLDTQRPRTITGEQSGDYCIPPDAILHESNGVGSGSVLGGRGGERIPGGVYVNQPPVPLRTHPGVHTDLKQKHRYPPLVPSDHYITDIQNLPPPAFPIDTALPLEDQP